MLYGIHKYSNFYIKLHEILERSMYLLRYNHLLLYIMDFSYYLVNQYKNLNICF